MQPKRRLHDLNRFSLSDMLELGMELRTLGQQWQSMEEAADEVVSHLYGSLAEPDSGARCCALVRFFKTHPYSELDPVLQESARLLAGGTTIPPETRCLTLLATAGDEPEWNTRQKSAGHKAIPLINEEMVQQAPMISQLILQLGLDISHVINPSPEILLELDQKNYNVFHVPDAVTSPYVPAKDFVAKAGVKSALGFGGMFPSGDLFAIVMFSKVHIPRETAEMFRTLALGIKVLMLPFVRRAIFAEAE